MSDQKSPKFVILAILDGWGIAADSPGNAITQAKTININKFWNSYPHTSLEASGQAVGLPRGEDGNTETGHINLGAGRIVYQDLERINMSIADGSYHTNSVLNGAVDHVIKNNSSLHLMGLVGAGGVHSNIDHLFALINLAAKKNLKNLYIHIFTDGRDSPPTAAKTYIKRLEGAIQKEGIGKIASIMGRYWAMDRDFRWDRTEKAYLALTKGEGRKVKTVYEAVEASYDLGQTDEFIEPSLLTEEDGNPVALVKDSDALVFFNFRIDRPRQLTMAFTYDDFSRANELMDKPENLVKPFDRGTKINDLYFVTMTDYGKKITDSGCKVAFPPEVVDTPLSAVISASELKQLKITESEKERFVTFYFNGLKEQPFYLEDRIIIPSPKVPTYDQKPEMSAYELTDNLLVKLKQGSYKFVVVNYPNSDMVGHTGNIGAAVKALEVVDECVGKLANYVLAYDGALIITADHGNVEEMINASTGEIDTEHSVNPVPFIVVSREFLGRSNNLQSGILADVAPTILAMLNLQIPPNMTGRNLFSTFSGL